ncbi:type III restriction enzyme [Selenomonas ruminantium]|uniref:Type III restriction enzyme n=1 Tax=Selenomonas ruminantium TaxID=971 RepID=A0A1I3C1I4_SELRU|nr:DEAD/DEAH box helicase family protein [Selenomonas ruminantium]SFH68310.1 type III restriction enzyme [Selenomonas ruminantium]
MELKKYQKDVLSDLRAYLKCLVETPDLNQAWKTYWESRDFHVGNGGIPDYRHDLPESPNVCMKVPTGGGKTIIACSAVADIFHGLGYKPGQPRMVVWLVPSDSILTQTLANLGNPMHPYHQRLEQDNRGQVEIFNKEQLLSGQGFSLDSVRAQLSLCVMSFASLRINSRKKDVRKVYQENGQLMSFQSIISEEDLLPDTPESSLIQTLRALHPVVIVDESHNAKSDLSVEMLSNLNPSFVLNLTATPRKGSNIISYVDARELQKESMVKLPVIVYNRRERKDVVNDALLLRARLEQTAKEEEAKGSPYVRPIILFQAEPKITKDKATFEKVKKRLMERGIPEAEIAIKTSEADDLTGVDLLSRECPIRYIITVNALKEGWDCPFAYILATLANKTSQVDVEQILGRVLRQPYTRLFANNALNMSYVLTCSHDFHATLKNVVAGLNHAGFSAKDFRAVDLTAEEQAQTEKPEQGALAFSWEEKSEPVQTGASVSAEVRDEDDDFADMQGPEMWRESAGEYKAGDKTTAMLEEAAQEAAAYVQMAEQSERSGLMTGELGNMQKQYRLQAEFAEEALALRLPQFFLETGNNNLFGEGKELLEPENLTKGFSLRKEDTEINFQLSTGEVYEVNLAEQGEAIPKYKRLAQKDSQLFRAYLAELAPAKRQEECVAHIALMLSKNNNGTADPEIMDYVKRVVDGMTTDEISALENSLPFYTEKIREKIELLTRKYQEKKFYEWLDLDKITCQPSFQLPKVITPAESSSSVPKSLYEAEKDDMNHFESQLLDAMVELDNVRWWHRINERKGMRLNAFINHYPDFIVKTESGKILLIEAKGDYLDGDNSKTKLKLGRHWQAKAGNMYKYFMVFDKKAIQADGAYTMDKFIGEILREL